MNNIRERIEKILKERSLTKRWLANKIEISSGNLNRTLENVSLANLQKIAKVFDISVNNLLGDPEHIDVATKQVFISEDPTPVIPKNNMDMDMDTNTLIRTLVKRIEQLEQENESLRAGEGNPKG